jgi:hypothetical protein
VQPWSLDVGAPRLEDLAVLEIGRRARQLVELAAGRKLAGDLVGGHGSVRDLGEMRVDKGLVWKSMPSCTAPKLLLGGVEGIT